jgi:hypothetical protein
MWLSLERELDLHAEEELLVPKDESQDVDQPHEEVHGVEETTHAKPSIRNGRKCTMKVDRLRLDVAQNVGAPTSQHRQRQSPDRFTGYMALMSICIVIEPSSFQEVVQEPTWVDAMMEGKLLIIVLYVDDLILTGDEQLIHSCKEDLAKEFDIKDMGLFHYFLGLEIWQ